jgi:hypothetical protein
VHLQVMANDVLLHSRLNLKSKPVLGRLKNQFFGYLFVWGDFIPEPLFVVGFPPPIV